MVNALKHFMQLVLKKLRVQGVIIGNHTQGRLHVREEIQALSPFFEFIHHDQLLERIVKNKQKPFCLITFDDGKKITATEAAIELERLGVPAVFYLVVDGVTNQRPLWFDRRNAIVRHLNRLPDDLEPEAMKRLPLAEINSLLDHYFNVYPVSLDMRDPRIASMSWEDVSALQHKGFTIGAHTVNHPILTNETLVDAMQEIRMSISEVEKRTEHACQSFAFPNGNYTKALSRYAMECGVQTVMTTIPTWVHKNNCLWNLPRVDIYNHYDKNKIWLKLSAALPGWMMKNPNGTGRKYVIEKWFMSLG
tara:strand:- start:347 stop:1264 length:918 start_codon:yes stop_codon:yes gene_type:complete